VLDAKNCFARSQFIIVILSVATLSVAAFFVRQSVVKLRVVVPNVVAPESSLEKRQKKWKEICEKEMENFRAKNLFLPANQGTLIEGESSVRLTSLY
jgi:hypothetical protein